MPHHAWYRPPGAVAHNNAAYSEHARDGSGPHLQFFVRNSLWMGKFLRHAILHLRLNGGEAFHVRDLLNLYVTVFFLKVSNKNK
jgi:hypothetical protein